MLDLATLLPYLFASAAGGFGAYVAIRSDLATLKAQVGIFQKSLDRAHERIDDLQTQVRAK